MMARSKLRTSPLVCPLVWVHTRAVCAAMDAAESDVLDEIRRGGDGAMHFRVVATMGSGEFGYVFKVCVRAWHGRVRRQRRRVASGATPCLPRADICVTSR